MKPPLFHPGQAVYSLISHKEKGHDLSLVKGRIYHVTKAVRISGGYEYELIEFSPLVAVHEWALAPVEEMPAEMLAELTEALEPVTA